MYPNRWIHTSRHRQYDHNIADEEEEDRRDGSLGLGLVLTDGPYLSISWTYYRLFTSAMLAGRFRSGANTMYQSDLRISMSESNTSLPGGPRIPFDDRFA